MNRDLELYNRHIETSERGNSSEQSSADEKSGSLMFKSKLLSDRETKIPKSDRFS